MHPLRSRSPGDVLWTVGLATVLFALLEATGLAAQTGRVTGEVVDTEGTTVENALVLLQPLGRSTVTGADGSFSFEDVPPGRYELSVRHLAFEPRTVLVDVSAGALVTATVELAARVLEVDPLDVRIEHRPLYLEQMGYYERMARGWGSFFEPDWVESRNVGFSRADQFVGYVKGQAASSTCTETPVYLDRRRIISEPDRGANRDRNDLLAEMSSQGIGAVEVYPTGHGVPLFALNDTTLVCGAVIMWSRRWDEPIDIPQIEVVLCEPDDREGSRTLEGFVRDELTDVPLPGATVTASLEDGRSGSEVASVRADRFGRYRICGLAGGDSLRMSVEYADHRASPPGPRLRERLTHLNLHLRVSRPGELSGRAVDAETRRPVVGAEVELRGTGLRARTDRRGSFRLREVVPGEYVITLRHDRYASSSDSVVILAGRSTELLTEMRPRP